MQKKNRPRRVHFGGVVGATVGGGREVGGRGDAHGLIDSREGEVRFAGEVEIWN